MQFRSNPANAPTSSRKLCARFSLICASAPDTIFPIASAPEIETNLYRIAQEALSNTHKHAKAARANVLLEKQKDTVILIIEDDGRGFNPKTRTTRGKGLDLIGMCERAALVGGKLEIESTPIFARVPALFAKKDG